METSMSSQHYRISFLQIKRKIGSVLWLMLFWTIVAFYQYADRYNTQAFWNCLPEDYEHWPFVQGILVSVITGGIILGAALVFLWENWLRNMSFSRAMGSITLYYTTLFAILTFIAVVTSPDITDSYGDKKTAQTVIERVFGISQLHNYFFWLSIALLSMTILLVRDKFGPGVFAAFIAGKYFRPKREERIFMFMDLKSSTTIAEKIGEEKYFTFLNDTFKTATPGILATKGEIYQYVGDEIVVSWRKDEGIKKANCIRCFYAMTKLLKDRSHYFEQTYRFQPEFKAGIHSGYVIAGEMGAIKREIAYSGDVLNTTARIQSKCNELKVSILISETLIQQIDPQDLEIKPIPLGALSLKGKAEEVSVFTL